MIILSPRRLPCSLHYLLRMHPASSIHRQCATLWWPFVLSSVMKPDGKKQMCEYFCFTLVTVTQSRRNHCFSPVSLSERTCLISDHHSDDHTLQYRGKLKKWVVVLAIMFTSCLGINTSRRQRTTTCHKCLPEFYTACTMLVLCGIGKWCKGVRILISLSL